ncbi:MAG: DUF5667 domain-containing protein [Patescibacteria group bacterium]
MKKIIVTALCLIFAFTILAFSVSRASAQDFPLERDGSESAKVSYHLAYPGLLPDHFLYPIKMIRDRIWLFLTTNKIDRSKLLLLYADKRLGAAKALIEGGKKELGLETLVKSEQYLQRVAAQLKDLDLDKECELANQVYQASLKHEEIMLEFEEKLDQESQKLLSENISYARRVQEELLPCVKQESCLNCEN